MKVIIRIEKKRRKKLKKSHLILILSFSLCIFFLLCFLPKEKPLTENKEDSLQKENPSSTLRLKENKEVIKKGETISDILSLYSLSPDEIHKMREDVIPVYDIANIKAGNKLRIYVDKEGKVNSVEYDIDKENYLYIKNKNGSFDGEIRKFPFETRAKLIWVIIEDNLVSALAKEDEKDILAISLADLFGWDIDFYADIRKGDFLKIIFEKKYLRKKFVGYGNILAAEFKNQGKTFHAFRYTYPDTKEWDYFDLKGNSLRKQFLKSPIKSARITSAFSFHRLHPIRKIYRPHYGIDYAAPIGTPVHATADGTITFTGSNGAAGRMIKIRHKNAYETLYLHLKGYTKGIRKGSRVEEGQVIAYVGSSGESTGPHLDYRIKHHGKYINPLRFQPKPVKPLRKEFFDDFKKKTEYYCLCLNAPLYYLPGLIN